MIGCDPVNGVRLPTSPPRDPRVFSFHEAPGETDRRRARFVDYDGGERLVMSRTADPDPGFLNRARGFDSLLGRQSELC
jgi:hypothetical protein